MTLEEWWTAYCVVYGPRQIKTCGLAPGEREFLDRAADDLALSGLAIISKFQSLYNEERSNEP